MNSIQELNPRHYKIIEFCLRGWTNKQIAENLGMSPQNVSIVTNSPSFQHELAIRRSKLDDLVDQQIADSTDDITQAIKDGAKEAVRRLVGCVDSPDEGVALRASQDVLDRAGYPRVSRVESRALSINLSSDDAKLISETLQLVGMSNECDDKKLVESTAV